MTTSFKSWKNGILALAGCLCAIQPVAAQQALNSVEVLVNDEPITSFDIDQRLRLVIAISGGIRTEEEFLRVREQVIRSMVDEKLEIQEAKQFELEISDAELESYFARRSQGMGQTPEQFEQALANIGSSKKTMMEQMEAEIVWSRLVQGRMGSFVSVSDEEVEATIKRIYDNKGKFELRLGEIVLLVDSPEQEASVKANAEELVSRIRGGASFPEIAQQLSASSSAAVGGDLGWLTADDLDRYQSAAIENIGVGEVADPVRTAGGYLILALRDRRRVLTADPLDAQVSLRQIGLSQEKLADADAVARFELIANNLHKEDTSCGAVSRYVDESGADMPPEVGLLRIRDLQPDVRGEVEKLEIGDATTLQKMPDGWRVLLLCDRREPEVQEPEFDAIYDQIEQQRLSMMARRYLRDIRRKSIIDYR
ncbi:peptidylprolyl isomerase [Pseudokordiimonas caeni]|uniref:peptidylprolyl isomerase n=1 Tax=Pseudokordiimonas caeni TaxID=2997908 RepID=UPI0028121614|nr:peptidylprolyl isomerase [Pseudokordiimonas caeni]